MEKWSDSFKFSLVPGSTGNLGSSPVSSLFPGVSDPLIPAAEIQVNYIRSIGEYPSNPFEE